MLNKIMVTDSSGNSISTTSQPDGTYTFKMPKGKVTVEVLFEYNVWDVGII